MNDKLINYLRDKDRNPYGVVVALKVGDGDIRVGYSLRNPKDRWDRALGIKIATARAMAEDDYALPQSSKRKLAVLDAIENMYARVVRYFKVNE